MNYSFQDGALVVTSISAPNSILKKWAEGAQKAKSRFILIGDSKSPSDFTLPGSDYYDLSRQRKLPFRYAQLCHEKSYTRKNIGYLLAKQGGAKFIVETDDDNLPLDDFWQSRRRQVWGNEVARRGWLNAYRYFSPAEIYPRGFPLEEVRRAETYTAPRRPGAEHLCPIQQGLADGNPDVDAIYRLLFALPFHFEQREALILKSQTWCPFNSQNTTFFSEAFPLLYLPTYCSFRMTDIWRSFIAQRIAWTCGWQISFHSATVFQERNEHQLLRDFSDEIPGYLNNAKIAESLEKLALLSGVEHVERNLKSCYQALIALQVIDAAEMELLEAWLKDLAGLN